MASIEGNNYIVTGASAGYGLAIARQLIASGANVGLIARNADKLEAARAELGEQAFAAVADVANSDEMREALALLNQEMGGIDGLINNAGIARPSLAHEYSDADIEAQLRINIQGYLVAVREVIGYLEGRDNPRIINISSASAEHQDEMWGLSLYAASKSAIERWNRDLRRDMQRKQIGVTLLRPGAAATDFANEFDFEKLTPGIREWNARQGGFMDTGMEVADVAAAVEFCLSQRPGVSVDVLEIRPNTLTEKVNF